MQREDALFSIWDDFRVEKRLMRRCWWRHFPWSETPFQKKVTFVGKQFLLSNLHFLFHVAPLDNSEVLLLFAQIHVRSPNLAKSTANFIFFSLLSLPQDKSLIFSKLLPKIELKLVSQIIDKLNHFLAIRHLFLYDMMIEKNFDKAQFRGKSCDEIFLS